MGFRFQRRIKLFPGFSLNFSKSGISASVGGKGLTYNTRGIATVGLPGTGLSYRANLNTKGNRKAATADPQPREMGQVKLANGITYEIDAEVAEALSKFINIFNESMRLAVEQPDVSQEALAMGLDAIRKIEELRHYNPECIDDCLAELRAAYNTTVIEIE